MARVKVIQPQGRPRKVLVPLRDWAVEVGEWVIEFLEGNNRIARGVTVNSLEVTVRGIDSVVLSGAPSLKWALQGRKPNKGFPPVDAIKNWILDKDIFDLSSISLNSLAFLIGRKIAEKGTNQPRLKENQISFVINQTGGKYLNQIGEIEAQAASDAMVEALTKFIPNTTQT